uniref:Uncharacterized protein n=1 Tax=Avena sativa TaxID=4498 RepID=A0ACD5YDM3_AVESA
MQPHFTQSRKPKRRARNNLRSSSIDWRRRSEGQRAMAIVGLIPFVYATIKRKRRRSMATDAYAYAGLGGNAARGAGQAHARAAYQSQSCHFAVRPSLADELGFPYDDYSYSAYPPPKAEGLSREPLRGRESARFDGGGGYQSQSCRFAARPSLVDELVKLREDGASRRPPAQLEGLSRQLLPTASRHDGLNTGSAYQSQSCRFAVHHHSAAYEHGLSHDEGYGAASTSPEDLSGKLLLTASRRDRRVSRSMRLGSMRVFAWVSGA